MRHFPHKWRFNDLTLGFPPPKHETNHPGRCFPGSVFGGCVNLILWHKENCLSRSPFSPSAPKKKRGEAKPTTSDFSMGIFPLYQTHNLFIETKRRIPPKGQEQLAKAAALMHLEVLQCLWSPKRDVGHSFPPQILLMVQVIRQTHQLIYNVVVYPIIYKVLALSKRVVGNGSSEPSTVGLYSKWLRISSTFSGSSESSISTLGWDRGYRGYPKISGNFFGSKLNWKAFLQHPKDLLS